MNMFARSKPIRAVPLQIEAPKLPRNFAEKLLEMETQLAFNMSVELISSLMQLYSSAIEYYESVYDKKYLHYKERLSSLLTRSDVLEILSKGNNKKAPEITKRPEELLIKHEELKSKTLAPRRPHTVDFGPIAPIASVGPIIPIVSIPKKDAEEAISEHLHESHTVSTRIKESLRNQEGDNLEKRIQARRRASSLKPQNKNQREMPSNSKIEMYQNEIESIMEQFAEEKILRTQGIKKKYLEKETELVNVQGIENVKKIKEDIDKVMKKEIEEMQVELLRERREKISLLRGKYDT
ncbi:hypothetical protein SteCoe_4701 [Stentor coeruleus]|uniref:Uncharacterized protein n=1 Tax=Stentor coeruleus TaxID=5963 RepID=A0A1R2CU77_9CILI|nr:hypothetical protein SteCoe_4701 [Stentor coeruleus]